MRTIACKTVWALLIGVSLVLSLNSCSKDPVIPEDETKNKLHEDPAKMTASLNATCTLTGTRYRRPEVPTKIRNPRPGI